MSHQDAFGALLSGYAYCGKKCANSPAKVGTADDKNTKKNPEPCHVSYIADALPHEWKRLKSCSICVHQYPKSYTVKKRKEHLESCAAAHYLSVSTVCHLVREDLLRTHKNRLIQQRGRAASQTLFDAVVTGRVCEPSSNLVPVAEAQCAAHEYTRVVIERLCVSPRNPMPRQFVSYPSLYDAAHYGGHMDASKCLRIDTSDDEEMATGL